jgi:hypothetical protein
MSVDKRSCFVERVALTPENTADSFGCQYGCGIFEFRKK